MKATGRSSEPNGSASGYSAELKLSLDGAQVLRLQKRIREIETDYEDQILALCKQIRELQNKCSDLTFQIVMKDLLVKESEHAPPNKKRKRDDGSAEEDEKSKLRKEVAQKDEIIAAQQQQITDLQTEFTQLKSEMDILVEDNTRIKSLNVSTEQQVSNLQKQLEEALSESANSREKIVALEATHSNEKINLEKKLEQLQGLCDSQTTKIADLQGQVDEQSRLMTQKDQEWESKLNSLTSELDHTKAMLGQRVAAISEITNQMDNTKNLLLEAEKQVRDHVEKFNLEKANADIITKQHTEEIKSLQEEVKKALEDYNKEHTGRLSLQAEHDELKKQQQQSAEMLKEQIKLAQNLQHEVTNAETYKIEMAQKLQEANLASEKQQEEYNKQSNKMQDNLSAAIQQNVSLDNRNKELQAELTKWRDQYENLTKQVEEGNNQKIQHEFTELETQISSLREMMVKMEEKARKAEDEKRQERINAESEKKVLMNKFEEQSKELKQQIEDFEMKYTHQKEIAEKEHKERMMISSSFDSSQAELHTLESEHQSISKQVTVLNKEVEKWKAKCADLEATTSKQLKANAAEKLQELEDMKSKYEELQQQYNRLKKDSETKEKLNESLSSQLRAAQAEVVSHSEKIAHLETELKTAQNTITNLTSASKAIGEKVVGSPSKSRAKKEVEEITTAEHITKVICEQTPESQQDVKVFKAEKIESSTVVKKAKRKLEDASREDEADAVSTKKQKVSATVAQAKPGVEEAIKSIPVVSLSGFKDSTPEYSLAVKETLINHIKALGGQVKYEDTKDCFDDDITHVISPPNARTIKTLAAALTMKWVISPDWIKDSHKAGHFVDESKYGYHRNVSPFQGKSIFLTSAFRDEVKSQRISHCKSLIHNYGKGDIAKTSDDASYILVGEKEDTSEYAQRGVPLLTWDKFIDFIYPKNLTNHQMEELEKLNNNNNNNGDDHNEDNASQQEVVSTTQTKRTVKRRSTKK